jgi:hypothetical protein
VTNLCTTARQAPQDRTANQHGVGSQRHCLDNIAASTQPAINQDLSTNKLSIHETKDQI